MAHIVIADDDAHIRELIGVYLQNEGFEVTEAEDGVAALAAVKNVQADLVILDIMMPGMDGWELCSTLRAKYPDLPLLMISAKGEPAHKVKGFRLGTDDYMTKPFDTLELVMRVKALLKRYRITSAQTVQLGKLQLNRQAYKVFRGDESFTLPLKEFELLYKLASFPGQIFTRDQLIEQIWGFNYEGDERTVDVHIKRLRERFGEDADVFRIETVRGLGYRLEVNG
ncbi:response regulator transcription factor [Paenibacillus aceti]|uniref:Heme response regulator HssR n=1 Tax=Paenibacillus aceti TaxID=1820010 RepID=A0ABQ1VX93_9BACL|nr:response regulator transcription factor [Paenibacillus aceti]GGG03854.1 DNA-binding response regulator [Paenibacillus aceti]